MLPSLWCSRSVHSRLVVSPFSQQLYNTREVAQLDASLGAVCREPSSIQLLEGVWEFLLGTLGGDEDEISKRCLISGCTVLDL